MTEILVWALSPKYSTLDFPDCPRGMTLDQKINVFEDRVSGWQIGIARAILDCGIEHSDFALLQILVCFFEMLGAYLSGSTAKGRESRNFKEGLKATIPNIAEDAELGLDAVWKKIRNGVYHIGLVKAGVLLRCGTGRPIRFVPETNSLEVCAAELLGEIEARFRAYVADLQNHENLQLRKCFDDRFMYDNKPP